jgi:hypothetical protein
MAPLVNWNQLMFSLCCSEQGILHTFPGTESDVIYPEVKEFLKKVLQ